MGKGRGGWRAAFSSKAVGAAMLVIVADQLFWAHDKGWTVGLFGLLLAASLVVLNPAVGRSPMAMTGFCAAVLMSLLQAEQPTVLGWALTFTALTFAAMAPRLAGFDDVWRWWQRLAVNGVAAWYRPVRDLRKARARSSRDGLRRAIRLAPMLILPTVGGLVFLVLFANANPVLARLLSQTPRVQIDGALVVRVGMAFVVLACVWAVLRPRLIRRPFALPVGGFDLPGVSPASVTLSLTVFNALFAMENALDIAFLWSGARLPAEFTLAEYAHRGAASLMVAALLTGAFVFFVLRPGSASAGKPWVRTLVILWVAQTISLVASCLHRSQIYVESYALTRVRILAMAWMALVAVGLALILWRMLRGRSLAWLVNGAALAMALVLAAIACADLGEIAAAWNLDHAREAGGRAVQLDLCYLEDLGPAALVPMTHAQLSGRYPPQITRQLQGLRLRAEADIAERQADWRGWTWRGARRLAQSGGAHDPQGWTQSVLPNCNRD